LYSNVSIVADDLTRDSVSILRNLWNNDYDDLIVFFDESVRHYLTKDNIKQVYDALYTQVGSIESIDRAKSSVDKDQAVVNLSCTFSKSVADFQVVFNKRNKAIGMFVKNGQTRIPYMPPRYVDVTKFDDESVIIGDGEWKLPGSLSIPKNIDKVPALILVHGSGPNDRDESIGPNKPFRDLAWGLASNGIATLRYEKRTKYYSVEFSQKMPDYTVYDEVINDVIKAYDVLKKDPRIDSDRIYILGHSLGGMLIPRIYTSLPMAKGLIIVSGPTRQLQNKILEQMHYLLSLKKKPSQEEIDSSNQVSALIGQINAVEFPKNCDEQTILGAPVSYWLDLKQYDPVNEAKRIKVPLLILQGGRDYQVTLDDYNGWIRGLDTSENVEFKLYQGLNHLLMIGKGMNPDEYYQIGHVDESVTKDIACWINAR
jgi:dipeptidyl aminopeptidase/acylaminoacyl peptidase